MDWLILTIVLLWPLLWLAGQWWGSRGVASEDERTLHRLREHHGFDPKVGQPTKRGP